MKLHTSRLNGALLALGVCLTLVSLGGWSVHAWRRSEVATTITAKPLSSLQGAPARNNSNATAVSGNQADNSAITAGAAYVFVPVIEPTISKAFAPTSILIGGSSTLTLTLTNPNSSALTGASFSDALTGLGAVGGAVGGTCAGTTPNTLAAGATNLTFSGITIPANGSCTVSFAVTSNTPGTKANQTSGVATTQTPVAGAPSNTAPLSVFALPTISKAFSPTQIQSGGISTVTLTLSSVNTTALTNGSFTDTLTNISAAGGAVGGTCTGTMPNPLVAGATNLSFSGITIPSNGSCTVIFAVTSNTAGVQSNSTSGVTTAQTPAGNASNRALLTVIAAPTIAKVFSPTSIPSGGTSIVTLTLNNSNASVLTNGAFTDILTNISAVGGAVGGTCAGTTPNTLAAGATNLSFSGITIPASSSCTLSFAVTSNIAGPNSNQTSGVTTTQTPV
ncbi:MAG: hypothetical protein M3X11_07410, partial [Acidobacteriota bacterium]|nr:hypothetical protein [Acidobacteriota bacterium]